MGCPPPAAHRPAPGRSPAAVCVDERAGAVARQWGAHPSQTGHGADLFVGAPGKAAAAAGVARTPAHRAPPIRARRPAWERPSMAPPPPHERRAAQLGQTMCALGPTGDAAQELPGATVRGAGELAIAPRAANLSASLGFAPPPGPSDGVARGAD